MHTHYGYRINRIQEGSGHNWLFLPGGPGLGSEYLIEFCKKIKVPGSVLLLDFPKDGTNQEGILDFNHWKDGLIELLKSLPNPILVTHSFAGMFLLNYPEFERYLTGMILMNTTTTNSFFQHVNQMQQHHNLPDLVPPASEYHLNPTDNTYKKFWETYKYYCFTPEELSLGELMIPHFAFNNESYYYTIQNFYVDYQCKWSPTQIPAMTITSENDWICPPQIFTQDKRFQSANIINKIIPAAGHCPWLIHFNEVQHCIDEFIEKLTDSVQTTE